MRRSRRHAAVLWALLLPPAPASAGGWDLIYPDRWDVTLCGNGCGIGGAEYGIALLVNTGSGNIDLETLLGATFTVTSSSPGISLDLAIGTPILSEIAPILPGEAVGSVRPVNEILLGQIAPGELFRNTQPRQFPEFLILRSGSGEETGPVTFQVTLEMGGYRASFDIRADIHAGAHAILFPGAARVTAVPVATTARPGAWGTLKRLYRQ